jgi:hypothetical protein
MDSNDTDGRGPTLVGQRLGEEDSRPGDYIDNGSIQHLSHVIQDLEAFYAREGEAGQDEDETSLERVQYMFRSNPPPSLGNADQFANGGGPAFLFTVFVPTADFFATMRRNQAALDQQRQFAVDPNDNGLERFITATRRQSFLVPPRRHRSFPLLEFV